jgi:WhiB family transcriptional regulator, redox-sensing transcriptional regulator
MVAARKPAPRESHMALSPRNDLDRQIWLRDAACREPQTASVFYAPPRFERKEDRLRRERAAKAICVQCSVRNECLEFAIETGETFGVWGGLTETERREVSGPAPRISR